MKNFLPVFIFLLNVYSTWAQNIAINNDGQAPNSASILDISSSNKGVLLPRLTTAQRNSISNPPVGLLVFDLNKQTLFLFDGQSWQPLIFGTTSQLPPVAKEAADGSTEDRYGYSVAVAGIWAVVGAPGNTGSATKQGAAYIFKLNNGTWLPHQKIVAGDAAANDAFGSAVSINDVFIVVGAPKDDVGANTDQGSAYVFSRSTGNWSEQQKISATGGQANENFGFSVSLSSTAIIAGAPYRDVSGKADQGGAYTFQYDGFSWGSQQLLTTISNGLPNTSGTTGDHFGYSVAMDSNYLIVGVPDNGADDAGAVHFYRNNAGVWDPVDRSIGSGSGDRMGYSVSISNDKAVAGAPGFNLGSLEDVGAVFKYTREISGGAPLWLRDNYISASDPQAYSQFGSSVFLNSNFFAVGTPNKSENGYFSNGSIYVYDFLHTNSALQKINAGDATSSDNFGQAVAVDGFNIIGGAPNKNNNKGKVYFRNIE